MLHHHKQPNSMITMAMIISAIPHPTIIFHHTNHNFQNIFHQDNIILWYKMHHIVLIKCQIMKANISLMIAVVQVMSIKCTRKIVIRGMESLASDVAVSQRKSNSYKIIK